MLLLCELDTNEAREFHNRQRAFGITSDARMYVARAHLEEREGDSAKALKILQEGLRIGAGPADILTKHIAALHMRLSPKQGNAEIQQILEPLEARADAHDNAMEIEVEGMSDIAVIKGTPLTGTSSRMEGPGQTDKAFGNKTSGRDGVRDPSVHTCLRRWLRIEQRRRLLNCLAGWKRLVELSAQVRREALFDALRRQLESAQRRCSAVEHCFAKAQSHELMNWIRSGLKAWRSLAQLCNQRKKLASAAYQDVVRHHASLVLWSWQRICLAAEEGVKSIHSAAVPEPTASLDSLLVDFCPGCNGGGNSTEVSEASEHPVLAELCEKPAAGKPSGVVPRSRSPERLPLASVAMQNARLLSADVDESKRKRGPERFFYDTSSYTGCARYGGPMIIDKKENTAGPAAAAATKAAGPNCSAKPQGQAQAQAKRNKPFLPR